MQRAVRSTCRRHIAAIMACKNSLAFAKPRVEAARTSAESRLRSPWTTPVIRNSIHL